MASEQELRLHRCCFTGHRPQKLNRPEAEIKESLEKAILQAVDDGFVTFITGMAYGVDIWAGQIVVRLRKENPTLHLIAAVPFKGFENKWSVEWKQAYSALLGEADIVKYVCSGYSKTAYQTRNEWMVDRSARVIAVYNGEAGGTRNTIEYARLRGITTEVCDPTSRCM